MIETQCGVAETDRDWSGIRHELRLSRGLLLSLSPRQLSISTSPPLSPFHFATPVHHEMIIHDTRVSPCSQRIWLPAGTTAQVTLRVSLLGQTLYPSEPLTWNFRHFHPQTL